MLWRELLAINSTKSFFVFLDFGCVTSAQMCLVRILMTHFCWAVKRFWSRIWFRTNKPGRKTLMSLCGAWKTWSQSCSVSQCCERYNEILTVRASCFCCCNQWLYWFHLLCLRICCFSLSDMIINRISSGFWLLVAQNQTETDRSSETGLIWGGFV